MNPYQLIKLTRALEFVRCFEQMVMANDLNEDVGEIISRMTTKDGLRIQDLIEATIKISFVQTTIRYETNDDKDSSNNEKILNEGLSVIRRFLIERELEYKSQQKDHKNKK